MERWAAVGGHVLPVHCTLCFFLSSLFFLTSLLLLSFLLSFFFWYLGFRWRRGLKVWKWVVLSCGDWDRRSGVGFWGFEIRDLESGAFGDLDLAVFGL